MFRILPFAGLAAATLVAATPAQAVQFIFTVTGAYTATFALDKIAPPVSFTDTSVSYEEVGGTFGGQVSSIDLTFDLASPSPSLFFTGVGSDAVQFFGPAVFTGVPGRPRFLPGHFTLTSSAGQVFLTIAEVDGSPAPVIEPDPIPDPDPLPGPDPTLDPLPDPTDGIGSVVPEPASWALMIGGFTIVGASMRRRRPAATRTA